MSKPVNVQSLLQAKDSLTEEIFNGFLNHYGIEIRAAEIEDLRGLAKAMVEVGCGITAFDNFFVGYKIPQIGKEFDLLRFGRESIINVELKSSSDEEKIKTQLKRNKYYLSFLGKTVHAFTFVSKTQELYFLLDDGQLERIKIGHLSKLLSSHETDNTDDPDALFNPSDYLVSPFNSTKEFLAGTYFLTNRQEEVKKEIIGFLKPPKEEKFISIAGSAGTGKTLLTYDIAKHFIEKGRKPLIIHCGQLNDGHEKLRSNGWMIVPIKSYAHHNLENYDLVIVDEAQRIKPDQLDAIVESARLAKCGCIFSYDKLQTLAGYEERRDIGAKIESINSVIQYKLSEKIRTNKEIATFIRMLFNRKTSLPISNNRNVEISYFNSDADAKSYLDALDESKWEVLRFTPSQYNKEHHEKYSETSNRNSHEVIGQEFDGVAVTIDRFFSYDENGNLIYREKAYYDLPKMLFQNITRARKKLNLVIIGNAELLDRCITILR